MEVDYHEITAELDAREILRYLNHLGIHNISGEALKYFITDLKKLIKYDLEQQSKSDPIQHEKQGPERLHSVSTFCSRSRSKSHAGECIKCSRECKPSLRPRKPLIVRNIQSAPVLGQSRNVQVEKPMRRACSCNIDERKSEATSKVSRTSTGISNNLIKVPRPPVKKKCDPVSLYHYYTSLWAKYKPNVPGENDWADLRWHIRQKMAGNVPHQTETRNLEFSEKAKDSARSINANSKK